MRRTRRPTRNDLERAARHFQSEYDRLWQELKETPYGYLFARGCISDDHLRARRVLRSVAPRERQADDS